MGINPPDFNSIHDIRSGKPGDDPNAATPGRLGARTTLLIQSKVLELGNKASDNSYKARNAVNEMSEKSEIVFAKFKQGEITKDAAKAELEDIHKGAVKTVKVETLKIKQNQRSAERYAIVGKIFSMALGGGSRARSGFRKSLERAFVSDRAIKKDAKEMQLSFGRKIDATHVKNLSELDNIEKNKINEAIKGIEDIERHLDDAFGPVATPREVAHNLDDAVDTVVLLREVAHKISETANRNLAKNDPVAPAPLKQNREISQKKNDETYKELNNLVARFMPKPNNAKASEADTKPSMGDAIERNKIAAALSHDPLHNA